MPTVSFTVRFFCHNGGNHRPSIHSRISSKCESFTNILGRNDYKRQVTSQYLQNIVKSRFPERIYTISSSSFWCTKYRYLLPANGSQWKAASVVCCQQAEASRGQGILLLMLCLNPNFRSFTF